MYVYSFILIHFEQLGIIKSMFGREGVITLEIPDNFSSPVPIVYHVKAIDYQANLLNEKAILNKHFQNSYFLYFYTHFLLEIITLFQ